MVLPIGARHITNDLAIGLRISLESAEKIKLFLSKSLEKRKAYGSEVIPETKNSDEVDIGLLGLAEEIRKVSKKTLIDGIIRPRLNEIFTFVGHEIKKSGFSGQTPSGLVISGGGARTIGAVDCAKRMLGMPVRIGVPTNIKGLIDEISDSPYAAVVGLVMYGATLETTSSLPFGISLPQFQFLRFNKIFSKAFKFIKSFMP